jgi:hypothetical protein
MTPEDVARLTLADLEAIAARFSAAVATIREAQALLGGAAPLPTQSARPSNAPTPAAQIVTPEQQAELSAWRNSPARAKLLEQFKEEPVQP